MKNTAALPPVQPAAPIKKQTPAGSIAVGKDGFPLPEASLEEEVSGHVENHAATVRPFIFPFFVRNHDLTLRESSIY